MTPARIGLNRWLLRLLFRMRLTDYNFVQLDRRKILSQVDVRSRNAGFLPTELMVRARDLGYRAVEVPITYHPRTAGMSVMGHPKVVGNSLRELFTFWFARLVGARSSQAR